jgi:hypothetical protein
LNTALRWAVAASPLGPLAVCVSERGVRALMVADDEAALERALDRQFPAHRPVRDQTGLAETLEKIDRIWQNPGVETGLELAPCIFRRKRPAFRLKATGVRRGPRSLWRTS